MKQNPPPTKPPAKDDSRTADGPLQVLVLRWTPEQIENAHRIVNDIAEDIDNNESRRELRMSLAIYADLLMDERERRTKTTSDEILKLARDGRAWQMSRAPDSSQNASGQARAAQGVDDSTD